MQRIRLLSPDKDPVKTWTSDFVPLITDIVLIRELSKRYKILARLVDPENNTIILTSEEI